MLPPHLQSAISVSANDARQKQLEALVRQLYSMVVTLVARKPEKGTDGYTPKKGTDYFTDDEIQQLLEQVTPQKGVHYFDGKEGKRGKDGKNGLDAVLDIETLIPQLSKEVLKTIPTPKLEMLVEMAVEKIKKEKLIDVSDIRNAQSFLFRSKDGKKTKIKMEELMHGAGSASTTPSSTKQKFTTTGGTQTIVLSNMPTLVLSVVVNGQVWSDDAGDYTQVGANITLNNVDTPAGAFGSIVYTYL
jgi:hypothetical protein